VRLETTVANRVQPGAEIGEVIVDKLTYLPSLYRRLVRREENVGIATGRDDDRSPRTGGIGRGGRCAVSALA
jgi:hypothetical protein